MYLDIWFDIRHAYSSLILLHDSRYFPTISLLIIRVSSLSFHIHRTDNRNSRVFAVEEIKIKFIIPSIAELLRFIIVYMYFPFFSSPSSCFFFLLRFWFLHFSAIYLRFCNKWKPLIHLLRLIYSGQWSRLKERLRLASRINDGNHHIHRICRLRSRAELSRIWWPPIC